MMKRSTVIFVAAAVLLALAITFFTNFGYIEDLNDNFHNQEYEPDGSTLTVHFIDVGQADCELITLPTGEVMLIDAGNNDDGEMVVRYIQDLGISKIDYLIGTHPHEDHIGGLDYVIYNFSIGNVYLPDVAATTKTYNDVISAIENKGLSVTTAEDGVTIYSGPETLIDIIAPVGSGYTSLNNYSAVVRLRYGNSSFLFTGDAETESENEITADVRSDVLKVGHHGSSTSSSRKFLDRVDPTYAVISCEKGNSYGHPHTETLESLDNIDCIVYRTDKSGTIICKTDGKNYFWESER